MENAEEVLEALDEVHTWAWQHFRYVPDTERWKNDPFLWIGEHWETREEINKDLATQGYVSGDCDAFAMMCWMELRKNNIKSRLVFCKVNGEGHLVVEHEGWILDNRFGGVMSNTFLEKHEGYKFLAKSGYEPNEEWTTNA